MHTMRYMSTGFMTMIWWTHADWSGYGAHILRLTCLNQELWKAVLQSYKRIQRLENYHG